MKAALRGTAFAKARPPARELESKILPRGEGISRSRLRKPQTIRPRRRRSAEFGKFAPSVSSPAVPAVEIEGVGGSETPPIGSPRFAHEGRPLADLLGRRIDRRLALPTASALPHAAVDKLIFEPLLELRPRDPDGGGRLVSGRAARDRLANRPGLLGR
jgi:hypothetical protein